MSLRSLSRGRIIFITGTDTGVGKTVFTGLLLHHLRQTGKHALALKPFCSGGREDVKLLCALQDGELSEDEINPYFFSEPVAPFVAARQHRCRIQLTEVVNYIHKKAENCEVLLVEGAGGLLVPLGEKFFISDVIRRLHCEVFVVAKNRLGTINHTLLTVRTLRALGVEKVKIIVMQTSANKTWDPSIETNVEVLRRFLAPTQVHELEFLGKNANKIKGFENNYKKMKKTLARSLR